VAHRRDIEGLRAVAVLAVLAYHAGVPGIGGGFVGVDVFLVISGFLITGLLLDERRRTGRIDLGAFYGRRIRRLLPISSVVLVTTAVVGAFVLPPTALADLGGDVIAAAGFVANMVFALRGTDYLTGDADPSAIQHYWSLAVEEQFYLLWPGLIALVTLGRRAITGRVVVTVGTVIALSLTASITLTASMPTWSYFGLHTRAWELGVGAALAIVWTSVDRLPDALRSTLGWVGLAAVGVSILTFDRVEHFPGSAALLPVLGTAAMIAAGDDSTWGPRRILSIGLAQWVGSRSYSLYLWHWPALVLGAAWIGREARPAETAALMLIAVGLSELGYRLVEDPIRRSPGLRTRPRATWAVGAVALAIAVGAGGVTVVRRPDISTGVVAAAPQLATPVTTAPVTTAPVTTAPVTTTPGASTTVDPAATPSTSAPEPSPPAPPERIDNRDAAPLDAVVAALAATVLPDNVRPSPFAAAADTSILYETECHQFMTPTVAEGCVFGDPDGAITIGLLGDSHAAQWFVAVDAIARERGWRLIAHTQGGCPLLDVVTWNRGADAYFTHCATWRDAVIERFVAEGVEVALLSQHWGLLTGPEGQSVPADIWARDLPAVLTGLRDRGIEPVLFLDSPDPYDSAPACAAANPNDLTRCEPGLLRNNERAVRATATAIADDLGVGLIDPHRWLCVDGTPDDGDDTTRCPVVIGDILVYRDSHHLSNTFVEWFTPVLADAIVPFIDARAAPVD
jgi:peptidoglycan/LPS O-acetylase OafA/YrhL